MMHQSLVHEVTSRDRVDSIGSLKSSMLASIFQQTELKRCQTEEVVGKLYVDACLHLVFQTWMESSSMLITLLMQLRRGRFVDGPEKICGSVRG